MGGRHRCPRASDELELQALEGLHAALEYRGGKLRLIAQVARLEETKAPTYHDTAQLKPDSDPVERLRQIL